jgi:hypothetical protein
MWDNSTFETVQKEFESREHALNWIIENQLGRRRRRYGGGDRKSDEVEKSSGQSDQQAKSTSSEKLATEYGVGERTIRRNANFAKVVDMLPEETKSDVLLNGDMPRRDDVNTILKMPKPIQKQFVKEG